MERSREKVNNLHFDKTLVLPTVRQTDTRTYEEAAISKKKIFGYKKMPQLKAKIL